MLGQPISMLLPQVIGFKLDGDAARGRDRHRPRPHRDRDAAREGRRLQVRRVLRPGPPEPAARRPGDDREHVARVRLDLRDLPDRRRDAPLPRVHRPPRPSRSSWSTPTRASRASSTSPTPPTRPTATRSSSTSATSCPSIAGPKRPQDRIALSDAKPAFLEAMQEWDPEAGEQLGNGRDEAIEESFPASDPPAEDHDDERGKPVGAAGGGRRARHETGDAIEVELESGETVELDHGHVVIAAITSCTNTSNPSVMLGAGPRRQEGGRAGLRRKPWVKTSLAPGSTVVTDYLERSGLDEYLTSSSSTSSATAAPPASGTPARCPRRSRRRSREGPGRLLGAVRATATSRAASTPTRAPTTWPRRRWWSPTRSRAAWTST